MILRFKLYRDCVSLFQKATFPLLFPPGWHLTARQSVSHAGNRGGEPLVEGWPCGSSPASTEMPLEPLAHQAVLLAVKQLVAGLGGHMAGRGPCLCFWSLAFSPFLRSLASHLFPQLFCRQPPSSLVCSGWGRPKAHLKPATQTSPSSPAFLGFGLHQRSPDQFCAPGYSMSCFEVFNKRATDSPI